MTDTESNRYCPDNTQYTRCNDFTCSNVYIYLVICEEDDMRTARDDHVFWRPRQGLGPETPKEYFFQFAILFCISKCLLICHVCKYEVISSIACFSKNAVYCQPHWLNVFVNILKEFECHIVIVYSETQCTKLNNPLFCMLISINCFLSSRFCCSLELN